MAMTSEEYLRKVAEIYDDWAPSAVAGAQPDQRYADNDPTQYPENIVAVSATPEDDARYWERIAALTAEYQSGEA